jgi:ATP-dependent DNA ligase
MIRARFIEPILLLRTEKLPEHASPLYEVKLDGFRAIAYKTDGRVHLHSRNGNDLPRSTLRSPSPRGDAG